MPQKKFAKSQSSAKKHTAVPPKAAAVVAQPEKAKITPVIAATPVEKAESAVATLTPPCEPAKAAVCHKSLINDLSNPDADIASDAAAKLGQSADPTAVEPLIQIINNTDGFYHSVVRAAAANSLGQLKDTRAVQPLINAINDPMAEASAEAVRALAHLKAAQAIQPLINVLQNHDGFFLPIVRRAAVFAVAQIGGPEATAQLEFTANNSWEDAVIRETAQQSLAKA